MRLLSSLQNRVFVATALLAVLPVGVALHFVSGRVTSEGEEQLRRGLVEAANIVEQQHSWRPKRQCSEPTPCPHPTPRPCS